MTRANVHTRLVTRRATLVPYRRAHVPAYHAWMTDPALLEATASEPLTVEEEYENQKSWRDDEGKMTFIVCDNAVLVAGPTPGAKAKKPKPVGDVNVFVLPRDDERPEELLGEIEVMIAEPDARRKGLATEAVCAMMLYARKTLKLDGFVAKIGEANATSLALFETKLKFSRVAYVDAFKEITLRATDETFSIAKKVVGADEPTEQPDVDEEVDALRRHGNALFDAGDFVSAVGAYDAALAIDERDAKLFANRSAARLRVGDPFGALFDALIAAKLDPAFPKARHRIAACWAAVGQRKKAEDVYAAAAAAFPSDKATFERLAKDIKDGFSPDVIVSANFHAIIKMLPDFLDLQVDVQTKHKDPTGLRLAEVGLLWRRLTGVEKHAVFTLFCDVTREDASQYDSSPAAWEACKLPQTIPGEANEKDLDPKLASLLRKLSDPGAAADVSPRVTGMEILFSACSWSERGKVGQVLVRLASSFSSSSSAAVVSSAAAAAAESGKKGQVAAPPPS